jgi:tetratricopeptide (TPR) repeat protein/DNA-binding SARP family transcriptional activator
VRFLLLGDVAADHDGRSLDLGGRQLRAVLATLLFHANTVVARSDVVRLAWGDDAPPTVNDLVTDYASVLRRAFRQAGVDGEVMLTAKRPGYLLTVAEEKVDWHRFRQLVRQAYTARDTGDPTAATRLLGEGLSLWRGRALADVGPALDPIRSQMEAWKLGAVEAFAALELARGRAEHVVPLLTECGVDNPTRERLVTLLIEALHATGGRDEAIAVYQRCRRHLDDLGLTPTATVEAAYLDLLNSHPPKRSKSFSSAPAQLPLDSSNFTGRTDQLAALLALVQTAPRENAQLAEAPDDVVRDEQPAIGAGVVCVVDGMAGVGKTALVVHAAHRVARFFPDGQLFLDLNGYTKNAVPAAPADALDRLLSSLGVPGERIPQNLDDRAALYRDRLADTRTLIVLDNASSADQIRPLLPASVGCLVLVTSRRRLIALDDVHTLPLEPMPPTEAIALFTRVAGADRVSGESESVERIADLCAGLPMAIRIVAAQLHSRVNERPRDLADRLSTVPSRPWDLSDGERSVAAAFGLSYRELQRDQRTLFRLLGLLPGADVAVPAAAALADVSHARAAELLRELLDAHLLDQRTAGRYALHDLMRRFAADLVGTEDAPQARGAAVERLLTYYLTTASAAVAILLPHEPDREQALLPGRASGHTITSPADARAWLDAERGNLVAAVGAAVDYGSPSRAWTLDNVLSRHLINGGHYRDALDLHEHALRAARQQSNRSAEGLVLRHLGNTYRRLGRYEAALTAFRSALEAHRETGDTTQEAIILTNLGVVYGLHGNYSRALDHLHAALILDQTVDDPTNRANSLTNIGNVHLFTGAYDEAFDHYQQALSIYLKIGDEAGQANALTNLAEIHERRGRDKVALAYRQRALRLFSDIHDRAGQGMALANLGRTHAQANRKAVALALHRRALEIFEAIGNRPGQSEVLRQLAATYATNRHYAEAAEHLERAFTIAREIGDHTLEATILNELGATLELDSRAEQALAAHRSALVLARRIGVPPEQARALEGIADLLDRSGHHEEARQHWNAALQIYTELDVPEARRVRRRLGHRPPPARP